MFYTVSYLSERTSNYTYNLRSRTHSFKLSSQHDDRNFIHRMLFANYSDIFLSHSMLNVIFSLLIHVFDAICHHFIKQ